MNGSGTASVEVNADARDAARGKIEAFDAPAVQRGKIPTVELLMGLAILMVGMMAILHAAGIL